MSRLNRSLQRAAISLLPVFAPHAAAGARWCRNGMSLSPDASEIKLLARLKRLIGDFRRRGLCREPGFDCHEKISSFADLARLPVLTKLGLIELYPRLKKIYAGRSDVFSRTTGGSTGDPASHLRDRKLASFSVGALLVMLRVVGWRPGMPRFCLWGREDEIGAPAKSRWSLRRRLSQLCAFGGYAPDERHFRRFYEVVRGSPGCAVYGYTTLLGECARVMLRNKWTLDDGAVLAAWGGAETVQPHQREIFERAFKAPLRVLYGSREFSSIAAECERGSLHINARYILEAVDLEDYTPLPPGEPGVLLVTDLANAVTPFVRYHTSDLGAVAWRECACGRRGPCLTDLRGRTSELYRSRRAGRFTVRTSGISSTTILRSGRYRLSATAHWTSRLATSAAPWTTRRGRASSGRRGRCSKTHR